MQKSILWARLLGLYTVIIVLCLYARIDQFFPLITDLMKNTAVVYSMGLYTVFLGLAIIVSHQVWRGWPILITVLGYWVALKGILLLTSPSCIDWMLSKVSTVNVYIMPVPTLIIGIILLYVGYRTN